MDLALKDSELRREDVRIDCVLLVNAKETEEVLQINCVQVVRYNQIYVITHDFWNFLNRIATRAEDFTASAQWSFTLPACSSGLTICPCLAPQLKTGTSSKNEFSYHFLKTRISEGICLQRDLNRRNPLNYVRTIG